MLDHYEMGKKKLKPTKLLKNYLKNNKELNFSRSLLGILKKQYLTVFDLCYVFEVQTQLSLVLAIVKASKQKLGNVEHAHIW